ncbi:MAG: hypothetical protein M3494_13470 [Actinomycetota bacterium]|nr:hypothetical protein [Actinomycetota bacterium]
MSARCDSCGCFIGEGTLETLREISSLPETLGLHACECGHPEMRRLPGGILHCPACGAEVLPIEDGKRSQTLNFHYESADYGGGHCPDDPPVPNSSHR